MERCVRIADKRQQLAVGLISTVLTSSPVGCSTNDRTTQDDNAALTADRPPPDKSPPPSVSGDRYDIYLDTVLLFEIAASRFGSKLTPDAPIVVSPLDEQIDRQCARNVIYTAVRKYPIELLQKHVVEILVVREARSWGVDVAGLAFVNGTIIIAMYGDDRRMSDDLVEQTVHHELSSIFWHAGGELFPSDKWFAINPAGFRYQRISDSELQQMRGSVQTWDVLLIAQGFLHRYAQTGLEEDFNAIAAELFLNREQFWNIVSQSDALGSKVELAIVFYGRLHASLTKEYFQRLPSTSKTWPMRLRVDLPLLQPRNE